MWSQPQPISFNATRADKSVPEGTHYASIKSTMNIGEFSILKTNVISSQMKHGVEVFISSLHIILLNRHSFWKDQQPGWISESTDIFCQCVMLYTFSHSWIKKQNKKKNAQPKQRSSKNHTSSSRAFYFFLKIDPQERNHFLCWAKKWYVKNHPPIKLVSAKESFDYVLNVTCVCVCVFYTFVPSHFLYLCHYWMNVVPLVIVV